MTDLPSIGDIPMSNGKRLGEMTRPEICDFVAQSKRRLAGPKLPQGQIMTIITALVEAHEAEAQSRWRSQRAKEAWRRRKEAAR